MSTPPRPPPTPLRDARVDGHATAAMHDMSTPPPLDGAVAVAPVVECFRAGDG